MYQIQPITWALYLLAMIVAQLNKQLNIGLCKLHSTVCIRSLLFRVTTLQTMWNSLTIPWWFAALLPMLSVTHIMSVLVLLSVVGYECNSAWSKTKMKCKSSAKSRMDANMQLTINSFRPLFPDKIFSRHFPADFSQTPWYFPNGCKIPWHFQVFQTMSADKPDF